MTSSPLVSIVTPTLNQAAFIEATIRSIKGQTYDHYEHIVVDGGSTDGTLDILRAHEGTYAMRWQSEPDRGMYDAVNKGMRQASGEIMCYLNSDDLYFPWTLETVVAAFRRRPEATVIHGDVLNVDDDSGRQLLYLEPPFDRSYVQAAAGLSQPGVFWRREVALAVGPFDETLRYVGDLDFFIRLAGKGRFQKVNEGLAIERNHRGTLREGWEAAMSEEVLAVRSRHAPTTVGRQRLARWRGGIWRRVFFRWHWLALLVQSRLPHAWRVRWWRRLLESGHLELSWLRVLGMLLLPVIGRKARPDILAPSRYWLEIYEP